MCNFENGFILCTCSDQPKPIVHHKNSRKHKKNPPEAGKEGYRWALARFMGTFEALMEGMYELPSPDLGAGLTAEWVLLNLNDRNCFDFDYTPEEGDQLSLSAGKTWHYMSFVYRQGLWTFDKHDLFSTSLEKISAGEIVPLPAQSPFSKV